MRLVVALLLAALIDGACDLQPFAAPSPSVRATCAPLVLPSPAVAAPTGKIRLSGIVRSAETCAGVGRVGIMAYEAQRGAITISATNAVRSDGSGVFALVVPEGTYRLLFVPPEGSGLAARWWLRASTYLRATSIDGARDGLDILLPRGFAISGNVVSETGAPLSQIYVRVSPSTDRYDIVSGDSSDENGHYSVLVAPGDYRVQFLSAPPWASQWWNKRSSYANADELIVSKDTADISVMLRSGRTVGGRVTSASASPVAGALAVAMLPTTTDWCCEFVSASLVTANGTYRLTLPDGRYGIGLMFTDMDGLFVGLWYPGGTTIDRAGAVVVDRDRIDIDIELP